jgi:hypothetical protein
MPVARRRRFRAQIFTAVLSRYRFVYPVFRETTETAIEACEAAWAFFHGVFRVLIPDKTRSAGWRTPRPVTGRGQRLVRNVRFDHELSVVVDSRPLTIRTMAVGKHAF